MASIIFVDVYIAIICFLILCCLLFKKPFDRLLTNRSVMGMYSVLFPINWPVIGMLPGLLLVVHRLHNFIVVLLESKNLTFSFKGPCFAGMDMLFTADPANIHYLLSSNFSNFTKGSDFKEIFNFFEESILTLESEAWKDLRKATQIMISHQEFQRLSINTTKNKLKDGLVPFFNHMAEEGTTVDLQDVFRRFTFDKSLVTVAGCDDHRSLSTELPVVDFAKALDDIGKGILYRHVKPRFLWKLQNWIGVGMEKKMIDADATFDRVCAGYISSRREKIKRSKGINNDHLNGEGKDLLTSFIKLDATKLNISDKFLRDNVVNMILAERDTTASALSWFFWLLSKNPIVLTKIRQEIKTVLPRSSSGQERPSYDPMEYLKKLVYLHGALCETLRLYPPVPIQRVSPVKTDVLPSGHKIEANTRILIFIYALGRMRAVWGENALEFKPERWISDTGELRHVPAEKFLAFNAGPRSCLGKHIAMILMKTVAVEILQNYDIKVAKGQKIEPDARLILGMKHGFKVTIHKRSSS